MAKLVEDHCMISSILSRLAELAEEAARSPVAARNAIRGEIDGLAAIVESHLSYEERAISTALDGGVPDTGWSEMVFRFREGAP